MPLESPSLVSQTEDEVHTLIHKAAGENNSSYGSKEIYRKEFGIEKDWHWPEREKNRVSAFNVVGGFMKIVSEKSDMCKEIATEGRLGELGGEKCLYFVYKGR